MVILGKASYVGEIALLRDVPRTATVRSRGPVVLYSLNRADRQDLRQRVREVQTALAASADARYLDAQHKLLMHR